MQCRTCLVIENATGVWHDGQSYTEDYYCGEGITTSKLMKDNAAQRLVASHTIVMEAREPISDLTQGNQLFLIPMKPDTKWWSIGIGCVLLFFVDDPFTERLMYCSE